MGGPKSGNPYPKTIIGKSFKNLPSSVRLHQVWFPPKWVLQWSSHEYPTPAPLTSETSEFPKVCVWSLPEFNSKEGWSKWRKCAIGGGFVYENEAFRKKKSENVIDSIDSITQDWCNGPNIFGALHHFDLRQRSSTAQRGSFVSCRVEEVSQFLKSLSASKRISGLIKCFRTPSKCYNLLTHWLQTHLPGLEGQETTNMVTNIDTCQQDSCPNAEQAWRAICLDAWR